MDQSGRLSDWRRGRVVVTPPSLVEQVVALCQERFEIDQKMFKALKEGKEMGELIRNVRKGK